MANWLRRLARRDSGKVVAAPPPLSTTLAVDGPGAPGRAGAQALYDKWSSRWQEF